MRRNDSIFLIASQPKAQSVFKMTKTRTAMFLVMIIFSCGLIFSLTDAYPTPEGEAEAVPEADVKLGNNSRLVITHVVKTIEFEVGVVDDDGMVDDNSTDPDASEFYETDIQLLNVDLLKEVVNQASGDENGEGETTETSSPAVKEDKILPAEGQNQQMQNESLVEMNKSES